MGTEAETAAAAAGDARVMEGGGVRVCCSAEPGTDTGEGGTGIDDGEDRGKEDERAGWYAYEV